jgi:hypothetical protein
MAGPGRPSTYTAEKAAEILERLASGQTLRSICRDEHMPPSSTVRWWVVDDVENFAARYAHAREMGMDELGDEIVEISDETSNDTVTDADGNYRANTEWISRSKLRVDSRKFLMSKIAPKRYGDKLDVAVSGEVSIASAMAEARERAKRPADG